VHREAPDILVKERRLTEIAGREAGARTDSSDFVAQAEKLVREGHAEEAIAVLDAGIATARDRPDAWRVKARAWRQMGDFDKANNTLDIALERFRSGPGLVVGLLIEKAELCIREGNFADASRTFGRLTEIQPENVEGWLGRGQSLLREEKAVEALACADKVIELDGRSAPGYTLRGDSQLQLRRWPEAFAAFAEAAEHDAIRFDASSWSARGDRFREYAQPEFALRAYERAIEQDPAFTAGFLDAGALCVDSGDFDRALKFFERAKEKTRPNDARPWLAVGGVHERRREYEKAQAAYEQATKIDPEEAETWNCLGNSLYSLGRFDESLASYRRAVEVNPDYDWPYHNLAYVFLKLGRFNEAIQSIDRALELDPQNAKFWRSKLWALSAAEKIEEIDATAELALETAGNDVNLRVGVASFRADAGRIDRARALLSDVQPSALETDRLRLGLAETLLVVGDNVRAVTLLGSIDSTQLIESQPIVRSFLHLLADRLASGAAALSEELLVTLLREFGNRLDQFEAMGRKWDSMSIYWTANGVRRLLRQSELPLADKLVVATLIDLLQAKIQRADLSFFADIWRKLEVTTAHVRRPRAGPEVL
jgi:tetratricopeptide (TPR) repeat protein